MALQLPGYVQKAQPSEKELSFDEMRRKYDEASGYWTPAQTAASQRFEAQSRAMSEAYASHAIPKS